MENLDVRGYRWRSVLAFSVTYAGAGQLYYLLRRGHLEPEGILIVCGLFLLFAFVGSSERYHLRIVDGVLSGPAPYGLRRVQFPIADIDLERSSKPNLFGGWTVWSNTGAAIYVDPITVPRAGRHAVLRALGLIPPARSTM